MRFFVLTGCATVNFSGRPLKWRLRCKTNIVKSRVKDTDPVYVQLILIRIFNGGLFVQYGPILCENKLEFKEAVI
jgi:hypothetical protein